MLIIFLFTIYALFYIYYKWDSGWWELSFSERQSFQEYRKEVGFDFIYCMKVKASKESYESLIKKRELSPYNKINKAFSKECKEVQWWDIKDNTFPEFSYDTTKDSLELITRINGVIYFTAEVW